MWIIGLPIIKTITGVVLFFQTLFLLQMTSKDSTQSNTCILIKFKLCCQHCCNIAEGQDHIWIFDNDVSKPLILLSMYKQVFHTIPIEHSDQLCNTKVDWFGQGCGKNFPVIKRNTFSTIKKACYTSILFITAFLIRIITQTSYKNKVCCTLNKTTLQALKSLDKIIR